jgi:hypothetical protein
MYSFHPSKASLFATFLLLRRAWPFPLKNFQLLVEVLRISESSSGQLLNDARPVEGYVVAGAVTGVGTIDVILDRQTSR